MATKLLSKVTFTMMIMLLLEGFLVVRYNLRPLIIRITFVALTMQYIIEISGFFSDGNYESMRFTA